MTLDTKVFREYTRKRIHIAINQKVSAMQKRLLTPLILSLVLCAGITASAAVNKKPLPKKPTVGTVQLAGDNGVFGTVYSICKQTPIFFRLKSAEFTTNQVVINDQIFVPKANEKLLVLQFTIQNPQKTEMFVRYDSLRFTAVDKTNTNCEGSKDWGDSDDPKHGSVAVTLKPAQTVNVFTPIIVPADGIVPKLMVLPATEGDGPVLRYDLKDNPKNKVTPLSAPTADPADTSGYTALETVPGAIGTPYPYQSFDITIEKFDFTTSAMGDNTPEDGERFLLVTMLMKNESPTEQYVRWDAVSPVLTSSDGEELTYTDMFLPTGNRPFSQSVKGLAEARVRMLFKVPKDVTPKTLALKEGESRTYTFEVK